MKFTRVQKAFIAIIVANIIWGAAAPIFKVSLTNIPPFTLAFWRFFIGAIVLLAFLGKKAALPKLSHKDWLYLLGYSISGITVNIMFFFWGLQRTYSINAPVIASAGPILTYILAMFYLNEKFNWKRLWGMLIGFIGIIVIVLEPLLKTGLHASIIGNTFLVIATLGAVVQSIIGKEVFPRLEPFAFTFWSFIIGAASFLPVAFWEYTKNTHLYAAIDIRGYMGIAFGALLSSAAGYSLYAWGLSVISASDAALFTYIDPVVGSSLSFFVLHEPITSYFVLGTLLIFGGIFVTEGRINYHPFHKFRPTPIPSSPPIVPSMDRVPHTPDIDKGRIIKKLFEHPMH